MKSLSIFYFSLLMLISSGDRCFASESASLPPGLVLKAQEFGLPAGSIAKATPSQRDFLLNFLVKLIEEAEQGGAKRQIGWLNFDELKKEWSNVDIWFNHSHKAILGSGNRIGSIYLVEQKVVILNYSLFDELTRGNRISLPINASFDLIHTHEFLGALGYPDDNYEISLYIRMRDFPNDYQPLFPAVESALTAHLEKNQRRVQNVRFQLADAGSSTGVGGGGDPASAVVKDFALGMLGANGQNLKSWLPCSVQELSQLPALILLARTEPREEAAIYRAGKRRPEEVIGIAKKNVNSFLTIETGSVIVFSIDE